MIDGYASFVSYFRKIAWQHNTLRGSFFVGDSWTLLAAQRSRVAYPAMWLERPVISPVFAPDGDSLKMNFRAGFSIVSNAPPDDHDRQEAMLGLCQRVAKEIVNRLKSDADAENFDLFVNEIRLDPLAVLMADDAHGWRVELTMETLGWPDCLTEPDWTLLDGDGAENLPLEPDYSPYVFPADPVFACLGTTADFSLDYTPGTGLRLLDCSTYNEGDRRRDVAYTVTDGAATVLVSEFNRVLTDAELAGLDGNVAWTITQTIKTLRGCTSTKTYTFDIQVWGGGGGTPPPATGVSIIDSENSRLLDSSGSAIIE